MKSIKTLIPVASLFAALFTGGAALAHTDEYLDSMKAPNGGQLRMAGVYHYELVVTRDGYPKFSNLRQDLANDFQALKKFLLEAGI